MQTEKNPKKTKLREQWVWQGNYRNIGFKIVSWSFETPMPEWPSGNWNFYIYLPEGLCVNFSEIWLADEVNEFPASGRKYVSHDYMSGRTGQVEMHGGITWYEKNGYTEGHRSVELGCDYQHFWDQGKEYDENDVLRDVEKAIDSCYDLGILKPLREER